MPAEPVVGQVVGRRQWTPTLFSLQAEADIQPFAAGQFGRVGLEIDGEKIFRPYSFVNPPSSRPLEFVYVVVPEGPLSVRLSELREGDPILMQPKPNGFLVMEEVPDSKQLWMLSTGTAVGPFISILREGQAQKRFGKIILAHAVRLADELVYAEDAREMAAASDGQIQYIPFVSREKNRLCDGRAHHGRDSKRRTAKARGNGDCAGDHPVYAVRKPANGEGHKRDFAGAGV